MTERKRVLLRLDPEVYERLATWAADDLRSVNAQIEYALRRALHAAGRWPRSTAGESRRFDDDPVADEDPAADEDPGADDDPGATARPGADDLALGDGSTPG